MKELIDITDEDLLKVINRIYILTENEIVSRNGVLGNDGKDSNYNKNHFCGYLKLQELGYKLPTEPQL